MVVSSVPRRDHIKAKLKQEDDIVEKIQTSRLRYFGHVTRMDKCRLQAPIHLLYMAESRETEPKVVIENAGWTMLQKTVNAVAGILWKLHV